VNDVEQCYTYYSDSSYFDGVTCPNHPDHCIFNEYVCDSEADCPDGIDETQGFCDKVIFFALKILYF
jgi:hypothetical protein